MRLPVTVCFVSKDCWIDELSPAVIPQKCCINYCRTNTIPSVNSSIFLLCSRRVNLIKSLNGYAMFQSIIQTLAQISTLENFCFSSTFLLLLFFFWQWLETKILESTLIFIQILLSGNHQSLVSSLPSLYANKQISSSIVKRMKNGRFPTLNFLYGHSRSGSGRKRVRKRFGAINRINFSFHDLHTLVSRNNIESIWLNEMMLL